MKLEEAKQEIARLQTIADGWKTIGSAFVAAAFGAEVEMGDVPPEELLQGVVAKSGDAAVNGTGHRHLDERHQQQVAAALLGRAYLLAPDTEEPEIHHTECSYPLCPNRRTERTMTEVEWSQPDKLATRARVCSSGGPAIGGASVVASAVCELWARWVAARVALGEVKLVP